MLWQWFFSNVVLISITNGSRGIITAWNLLMFTFPLFWSIIFSFLKAIVSLWNSLQWFVAMFKFFGILIEVKYLRNSLPFPTRPLNFWRFRGTGRFDRVFPYFFWWVVLFSSTTTPWSTSVFLFSNSTISTVCIYKSSKHFSRTFGLCESDFNSFKSSSFLENTSLVFHLNHQIYCRQHVCRLFHYSQVR